MTSLIIGCGYLGQRVGAALGRARETVYGTVRTAARAAELAAPGITPVVADVLDPAAMHRLPAAERVFYCVGFDRSSGHTMRAVYVDGLLNVLDNLHHGVTRFVYASSTGVYGQTEGEWVDESTVPAPRTPSGEVCLEAEDLLRERALARGGEWAVVLRFAGLYGPGRIVRRTLVERGEPIPGEPSKLFNLIHIEDAATAAIAALEAQSPEPLYLASDDRPVTRREYYTLLAKLLDAPEPTFAPAQAGDLETGRDATSKRVSNRRMKSALGVDLMYPDITTGLPAALWPESRA